MDTLHERLRHLRKMAGFPSARSAAIRFGWSPSTYAAHENGQNSFDPETALRYATAFKGDPSWLLFAKDSTPEDNNAGFVLKLAGYLFNSVEVKYIDKRSLSAQRTIVCFTSLPANCFLFQVEDDSLEPRYEKSEVLVFSPMDFKQPVYNFSGKDQIALFEDGSAVFCKILKTDVDGIFDLMSPDNPTLHGISLLASLIHVATIAVNGYVEREGSQAGYRP